VLLLEAAASCCEAAGCQQQPASSAKKFSRQPAASQQQREKYLAASSQPAAGKIFRCWQQLAAAKILAAAGFKNLGSSRRSPSSPPGHPPTTLPLHLPEQAMESKKLNEKLIAAHLEGDKCKLCPTGKGSIKHKKNLPPHVRAFHPGEYSKMQDEVDEEAHPGQAQAQRILQDARVLQRSR
jgi:hypothetical protein